MEKTFEHLSVKQSAAAGKSNAGKAANAQTPETPDQPLGKDHASFGEIQRRAHLRDLEAKVEALRDMGVRSSPSKHSAQYFHNADDLIQNMHGIYAQANPIKRSVLRRAQFEDAETKLVRKTRQTSRKYIATGRALNAKIHDLDAATKTKRTILTQHAASALESANAHAPLPVELHRDAFHKLSVEIQSMVQELVKIKVDPEVRESILQTDSAQAKEWSEHWKSVATAEPLKEMQQMLVDTRNISDAYSAATLHGEQIAHTGYGDLEHIAKQIDAARSFTSNGTKAHVAPVILRMEAILEKSKTTLAKSASRNLEIPAPDTTRQTTIAKASRDRAKLAITPLIAVEHPEAATLKARFEALTT